MPNEIKEMTQEEKEAKEKAFLRKLDDDMDSILAGKDCKYPKLADCSRELKIQLAEYHTMPEEEMTARRQQLFDQLREVMGIKSVREEMPESYWKKSTESEQKKKAGPSNFFMEVEPLW
uniref:Enkurin domain-containing protein n=1 Tax=Caenorhabditis tropicalis TaxID=1561998 RepID=A0A1I7UD21_9PELO